MTLSKNLVTLSFMASTILASQALAEITISTSDFERPEYTVIDRNFVNMATGKVYHTFTDVSIGGSTGLTHSLSNGFVDNFLGTVKTDRHYPSPGIVYEVRVSFTGYASAKFLVEDDGSLTPLDDLRNEIEEVSGVGYVLTQADGTKLTYTLSDTTDITSPGYQGILIKVEKPNGLIYDIKNVGTNNYLSPYATVSTNTGYMLKYKYSNSSIYEDGWSHPYPESLTALNTSIDYCSDANTSCTYSKVWPSVTYNWPEGHRGNGALAEDYTYSATTSDGRVLEYYFKAYDDAYYLSGIDDWSEPLGTSYTLKLHKIKLPESTDYWMNYRYEHDIAGVPDEDRWEERYHHQLRRAYVGEFLQHYDPQEFNNYHNLIMNYSGGPGAVNHVYTSAAHGVITEIDAWNQKVKLENARRNRVISVYDKLTGQTREYGYDARGNITTVITGSVVITAKYPDECTAANRKYCNKPTWVKGAKDKKTHYTYHTSSGQVASVTYPANKQGLIAQTRYGYEQKYASYKKDSDTKVQADTPIWLLTSEKSCQNSNYLSDSSACEGSDEVVINYEYNSDNLHMTGKVITANGKSLRTCYSYDIYGNQISETKPKAGLATCN